MKIEIEERKDNPLLERKEIKGTIDHTDEATPSIDAVTKFLVKELGADEDDIKVDKIFTLKGEQKSKFWAKELGVKGTTKKKPKKKTKKKGKKEDKEEFKCEECGDTFDSKRGLSIHQSKVHGGEEEEEETEDVDYEELLSGTISEGKKKMEKMDNPDYEKLLEAEKAGKDRKGMKSFLEGKLGE